MTIFHCRW